MSANILQENTDLLLTELGDGILNDNAALRRIVDISSTNKTSATIGGSSNSSVVPATNNSATLSNPINEVA